MNGVITDDEHCHEMATKQAFERVGLEITEERYRKFCLGRTDVSAFGDLLVAHGIEQVDLADLIAHKTELYLKLVEDELKVYPGVIDLIHKLESDYMLALTTSSTLAEAQTVIDLLELAGCFEVVVTAEDVKKGKPDPEPYLLTLYRLEKTAEDCVVIEDSENGIKSAKAAGLRCIAIPNTENPKNLWQADQIVADYSEIDRAFIEGLTD